MINLFHFLNACKQEHKLKLELVHVFFYSWVINVCYPLSYYDVYLAIAKQNLMLFNISVLVLHTYIYTEYRNKSVE